MSAESLEQKRQRYRPQEVRGLFIGESPPANGTFFYSGDSILARHTREAFEAAFGAYSDMPAFLAGFRDCGCFLVDLCETPVNRLPDSQRRDAREAGLPGLVDALRGLRPEFVAVVMAGIEEDVMKALRAAGLLDVETYVLPFPVRGRQRDYVGLLADVLRRYEASGRLSPC